MTGRSTTRPDRGSAAEPTQAPGAQGPGSNPTGRQRNPRPSPAGQQISATPFAVTPRCPRRGHGAPWVTNPPAGLVVGVAVAEPDDDVRVADGDGRWAIGANGWLLSTPPAARVLLAPRAGDVSALAGSVPTGAADVPEAPGSVVADVGAVTASAVPRSVAPGRGRRIEPPESTPKATSSATTQAKPTPAPTANNRSGRRLRCRAPNGCTPQAPPNHTTGAAKDLAGEISCDPCSSASCCGVSNFSVATQGRCAVEAVAGDLPYQRGDDRVVRAPRQVAPAACLSNSAVISSTESPLVSGRNRLTNRIAITHRAEKQTNTQPRPIERCHAGKASISA